MSGEKCTHDWKITDYITCCTWCDVRARDLADQLDKESRLFTADEIFSQYYRTSIRAGASTVKAFIAAADKSGVAVSNPGQNLSQWIVRFRRDVDAKPPSPKSAAPSSNETEKSMNVMRREIDTLWHVVSMMVREVGESDLAERVKRREQGSLADAHVAVHRFVQRAARDAGGTPLKPDNPKLVQTVDIGAYWED